MWLKFELHFWKALDRWRPESRFSIRKKLSPKELKLVRRFQRTLALRNLFPYRSILLYFVDDPNPLRDQWPILKEVDEHYHSGSEEFKKLVNHLKLKLRKTLKKNIPIDKCFVPESRR